MRGDLGPVFRAHTQSWGLAVGVRPEQSILGGDLAKGDGD